MSDRDSYLVPGLVRGLAALRSFSVCHLSISISGLQAGCSPA